MLHVYPSIKCTFMDMYVCMYIYIIYIDIEEITVYMFKIGD